MSIAGVTIVALELGVRLATRVGRVGDGDYAAALGELITFRTGGLVPGNRIHKCPAVKLGCSDWVRGLLRVHRCPVGWRSCCDPVGVVPLSIHCPKSTGQVSGHRSLPGSRHHLPSLVKESPSHLIAMPPEVVDQNNVFPRIFSPQISQRQCAMSCRPRLVYRYAAN